MKQASLTRLAWLAIASLFLLAVLSASPVTEDQAANIKSKDPNERLAATHALIKAGGENLAKQLIRLLKDSDWEIVIAASRGLGECGGEKAVNPLIGLAYKGPIREIRAAAADSLAKLAPEEAASTLGKKLKKQSIIPACEALVAIAPALQAPRVPKGLAKLLRDKQLRVRAAAAGALVALSREDRGVLMKGLLWSEYLSVRARALEVAAAQPTPSQVKVVKQFLEQPDIDDVLVRRALPALAAGIDSTPKNPARLFQTALESLCAAKDPRVARRGPLFAKLAARYTWGASLDLLEGTAAAREHEDPGVRAGAARLLGDIKGHGALSVAKALFDADSSARVRRAAFDSLIAIQPLTVNDTRTWIIGKIPAEPHPKVRQRMAVALGNKELVEQADAAQALIDMLGDSDWGVAACAAVSLGLTRSEHAPEPLTALARDSADWRLRGAAVVGLSKSLHKASIPGIITALADPEPVVVRTAHAYLVSINRSQLLAPDVEAWTAWWAERNSKVRLRDPREQQERNKKYGYEASDEVIYRGLDVVVLDSRGDHIQAILKRLGIEHRLTRSSKIKDDGLDAGGVFVSNCTGEMETEGIERLEWFVKVGGYLCGSCWAMTETIERIEPGVITKLNTRDEILDDVLSSVCDPDSPYTKEVFAEYVQPIYHLEGAHIINVLQPERVEILVDSVECAEKWGGGNLACWFSLGHGTILDSANHFYGQGLENALGLKKPEQRMAFAVDHMGTTLARIRETAKEKFWTSNHKAAKNILDLSVFRLVTNFVRLRRLEGR